MQIESIQQIRIILIAVDWELYGLVGNQADELYIVAREPNRTRPNKPQTFRFGVKPDS
jgi:hypothetical protein